MEPPILIGLPLPTTPWQGYQGWACMVGGAPFLALSQDFDKSSLVVAVSGAGAQGEREGNVALLSFFVFCSTY